MATETPYAATKSMESAGSLDPDSGFGCGGNSTNGEFPPSAPAAKGRNSTMVDFGPIKGGIPTDDS
jgi:hypothetical protein